jgi:hypothetical protein
MNPNVEKARAKELQVLAAVGLVGWLTAKQIAAWVWPDNAPGAAKNRAAETLQRLVERRHLLRRETATGAWSYLLTRTGAARVNEQLVYPVCREGYDLSQLDVDKQASIVAYLLAQKGAFRLGPSGVRGAVRAGLVEKPALRHADALTRDPETGNWVPAMLARTLHPKLVEKARKLRDAAGRLELLGHPVLLRQFNKAMADADEADQEYLGGSW